MPETTTLNYRILFEIRVLHDYYLFGMDPSLNVKSIIPQPSPPGSYFAMNEAGQHNRLQNLLRRGLYDVGKDLEFILGRSDAGTFGDLRLRMIKTPAGFLVGIEVKTIVQIGGAKRFRPMIDPPEDATLTFGIGFLNPSFGAISNLRLDRDTQDLYYFTNRGDHDGMSLSKSIAPIVSGKKYRMGDLALVGGKLHQANADNTGDASFWEPVAGSGFVHQADRSLNTGEDWFTDWRATLGVSAAPPKGVIQIALKSGNGSLSPLDSDGFLNSRFEPGRARPVHPVFDLRFLSQATYWRYRKTNGFTEEEVNAIERYAGKELVRSGSDFVTLKPRPAARELPRFPLESAPEFFRLPNAQPGSLRAGDGKLFSEIFLDSVPVT